MVALIATVAAWGILAQQRLVVMLVAVAPLLLPLPGLWRGSRYSGAWSSLLVIPYMLFGLVEVIANPAVRLIAALELTLSFVLFAGLLLLARGRSASASCPPS